MFYNCIIYDLQQECSGSNSVDMKRIEVGISDLYVHDRKHQLWLEFFFFIVLKLLNPLHPNISIHILSTVRYIHPKLLTRRICFKIKSFFFWRSFSLTLVTLMCDIEVMLYREISCQSLSEIKISISHPVGQRSINCPTSNQSFYTVCVCGICRHNVTCSHHLNAFEGLRN